MVGACAIVDRSGGKQGLDVPFHALLPMDVQAYQEDECPLCKQGLPVVKPGSVAARRQPTRPADAVAGAGFVV